MTSPEFLLMKKLLEEIYVGIKAINNGLGSGKGLGTKSYISKRIDLLREYLGELKESL